MTIKLTAAQTRDLLAAAEAGGTHPATTHGPVKAVVDRGLAVEVRPVDGGYSFDLTTAGWDAARSHGYQGPGPAAPVKPTVERFDSCPRCGFAFPSPQPECRVRSACDKRATARAAATA